LARKKIEYQHAVPFDVATLATLAGRGMYAAPRTELFDALPAPTLDVLLLPFELLLPLAFSSILRRLSSLRRLATLRAREEAVERAAEAA